MPSRHFKNAHCYHYSSGVYSSWALGNLASKVGSLGDFTGAREVQYAFSKIPFWPQNGLGQPVDCRHLMKPKSIQNGKAWK